MTVSVKAPITGYGPEGVLTISAGHTLDVVLGHESVATTEIYTHVSVARQRRTVQLLEK